MIALGLAREPAQQRERELVRRAARPRLEGLADAMPAISLAAGVVLALAIGAPTGP